MRLLGAILIGVALALVAAIVILNWNGPPPEWPAAVDTDEIVAEVRRSLAERASDQADDCLERLRACQGAEP